MGRNRDVIYAKGWDRKLLLVGSETGCCSRRPLDSEGHWEKQEGDKLDLELCGPHCFLDA